MPSPERELPAHPPPEVLLLARWAGATDTQRGSPTFLVGSDPFLAFERAARATWRAARMMLDGLVVPDPPDLPELRRCSACATLLRMVRSEATGRLMPVETTPHLDGIVKLVPSEAGVRARVFGGVIAAQLEGGTRYRPHWADCSHAAKAPT